MRIHAKVMALLDECITVRRELHKIPELGFEEYRTSEFIMHTLRKYAPDKIQMLAHTGVKAVYYAKDAKETIAFRADIDGLAMAEQSDLPYKSTHENRMHACGHDGHTTILLLMARLIHEHRDQLAVNVVLLFQPAEEGKGGASRMIAEGALKNPTIDRIYGFHVWPDVPMGKIGVRWGPLMAKTCEFDVTVHGLSAHGASPQNGVDAVVTAAALVTFLQTAISRDIDPHQDALLTIGRIEGGTARNIIADKVTMNATLRVFTQQVYDQLMTRIHAMADGLAVATGAKFEITELLHYPCVDNPRKMLEDFYQYLDPEDMMIAEPVMAAEDFSFYQLEIPGIFLFLGIGGGRNAAPLHNGYFDFDEEVLLTGVEIYRRLLGLCE